MNLSKKSVIKHSAAIQITNKINLLQRQGWNVLLANAYGDLLTKDEHQVTMKDFKDVLCLKTKNESYIKKFLTGLVSIVIEWNILDKDGDNSWEATGLLSRVKIKKGVIYYAYDSVLKKKLHNPDMYARISLSMQNKFGSKHSLALYELCIDYYIAKIKHGETPFISIQKFRGLMGFSEKQYKEFKTLKRAVISPAIKEINDKSDLFVEVEYGWTARKITALKLHITPNSEWAEKILKEGQKELEPPDIKNLELYKQLTDYFLLSPTKAQWVINNFSKDQLLRNLEYVKKRFFKGEIKEIGPYTLKIIEENGHDQKSLFEVEKEEKEKRVKKRAAEKQRKINLEEDYQKFRLNQIEQYKKSLPADELKEIEASVSEKVKKKYPNGYGVKTFIRLQLNNYIEKKAGIPNFEKWGKINNIKESVAE